MANKILTVPEVIEEQARYYCTGNEWVALPEITEDGAIHSFNILSERHKGMLEVRGGEKPLLRPIVQIDGAEAPLKRAVWSHAADWLPRFDLAWQGVKIRGTIFCPGQHRGFVYLLELKNNSGEQRHCSLAWVGSWLETCFTVYRSRRSAGLNVGWYNRWTRTLTFEHRAGLPALGWAVGLSTPLAEAEWHIADAASEDEVSNHCGDPLHFYLAKDIYLRPGECGSLALYTAVNNEADGAGTCVIDLQRHGSERLLGQELDRLCGQRLIKDERWGRLGRLCNRNAFFNYFFARGRCLDTERTVLMTTRSPRYYVSAAFWARDAYLWSFPALLRLDREAAEEALLLGSSTYRRRLAEHSLYMDGTELYPGFELDEHCAWLIALGQYLAGTKDWALVAKMGQAPFTTFLAGLEPRKGPNGLYDTFLSPTDDPVDCPYLTYNNVLVWRSFLILAEIFERSGCATRGKLMLQRAERLAVKIRKNCIVDGPHGQMYAWAVDGRGRHELLDQPPGSLQLLQYYGFCASNDPVYKNTVAWIHSTANPHYVAHGKFSGPGCEHAPYPWVLSLCYELLNGDRQAALELLAQADLDNGLACETVDAATGRVKTGAAFATCAGFLAHSLALALQGNTWV